MSIISKVQSLVRKIHYSYLSTHNPRKLADHLYRDTMEKKDGINWERPVDLKKLVQSVDKISQSVNNNEFKRNILLVDDDTTFLKMMKNWLEKYYRVTIVTSGTQALMYLADNKPDLILLDYEMPVTSGPQVLEMIRSETKVGKVPVMFLTGKSDKESIVKVLALKPDGYLLKSLNSDQILATLSQFFSKNG